MRPRSKRPSPLNQIDDENNDCNYQQQMDQSAAKLAEKTKEPENEEYYKYGPQHNFYSVNFLETLCATAQQKDQKQNRNWYPKKPQQNVSCRACFFDPVQQMHVRSLSVLQALDFLAELVFGFAQSALKPAQKFFILAFSKGKVVIG
jgi:hypothetical protein